MHAPSPLSDLRVHVKIRLASLWTSLMFRAVTSRIANLDFGVAYAGVMMLAPGGAGAPA